MTGSAAHAGPEAAGASEPRRGWLAGDGFGWAWEIPHGRWMRFWFPLLGLALGLLIADLVLGASVHLWSFLVLYHSPFGMYTGMPYARALGFSPLFLLLLIAHLHVFGGLFLVWNMDWLKALPWLGPRIARIESKGQAAWEKRPRLRHLGVVGLAVYTFLPVTGTGLITGCILGRLVGMPWFPAWVAVVTGGMARIVVIVLVVYMGWGFLPFG